MSYCNQCGVPHSNDDVCGREPLEPLPAEVKKGVNYLKIHEDSSTPILWVKDGFSNSDISIVPRKTKPSICFVFGMRKLTFTLNEEGKIDVEYNPEELTEAAQKVVDEVKRLLGVEQ